MPILTVENVGQSFGAVELFSGLNLRLEAKNRVGLVGPNGVGKTTLLRILSGESKPTAGIVQRQPDLVVGSLRQEAALTFANRAHTIYEEMLTVFAPLREMERRLRQLEQRMSEGAATDEEMEEYGRLQHSYDHGGGYQYPHDIKRVLMGLGFPQEEWDTPLPHLSGGQKTRLSLGRLLLEKPDLLILDEPTNHLDAAAVDWLEDTLRNWRGALIIVSHDRYFLDKTVNMIWAMERTRTKAWRGNYTAYARANREEREREAALFATEKGRLEAELAFIRKHIAGGKTDIAKGKLKRLTRDIIVLEQAIAAGESLDNLQNKSWLEIGGRARALSPNEADRRLRRLTLPDSQAGVLNIALQAEESGRIALRTDELEIGYPDAPLFTTPRIKLERGERAAIIGPNGCGKTAFLRALMGEIKTRDGWLKFGANTRRGYFAQSHDQLDPDNRALDEILRRSEMNEQEARGYLARYLFKGDAVFKRVAALSGGERGRLALALLALNDANFLLLDEPTNHLDIPSQEALQTTLEAFNGTIALVSHDRYLVDRLATQIWEVENGRLHIHKTDYQTYLRDRAAASDLLDPLSRLDDETPEAEDVDLDWVEDLVDPLQAEQTNAYQSDDSRRAELKALEAQLNDEMVVAEALGDQAMLTQLEEEYRVVLYQLAAL